MLAVADCIPSQLTSPASYPSQPLKDFTEDGILWAVPKNRRSREKRMTRKFGHQKMLPIIPLKTCNECGHAHEPGRLCRKLTIFFLEPKVLYFK